MRKSSNLLYNPDAPGSHGLIALYPIANGSSELSYDPVGNTALVRANFTPNLVTTGEAVTSMGVWMPYLAYSTGAHSVTSTLYQILGKTGQPFTVLVWCYPPTAGSSRALLGNSGSNPRFYLSRDSGNTMAVGLGSSVDLSMSSVTAGVWQMWSWAYDGTNVETTIDGRNLATAGFTGSKTVGVTTRGITVGNSTFAHGSAWNEKVGPMAVYDRYLNPDEIRSIWSDFWGAYMGGARYSMSTGPAAVTQIPEDDMAMGNLPYPMDWKAVEYRT